jgi:FdhE protein
VCGRCDAQWVFQRLQCPYCQCTDQESLSYLTDSTGLYRLYFCDECRSYLKALDLRAWQAEVEPVGQRAETLDLDRQARQRGFRSPDSLASLAA